MDIKKRLTKSDFKKGTILFVITIGFSIPYILLMIQIQKETLNDFTYWPLALFRIVLYSLFSPLVFIITLSIIGKYKLLAKLYTLFFVSLYFIALLIILVYFKYFGTIPYITLLSSTSMGNGYEALPILIKFVYYQLLSLHEWLIIFLLFFTLFLTFVFLRLPKTRQIKSNIKYAMLLLVVLIYYGLYEIQLYRYRDYFGSNTKWLGRTSEAVLYFGLSPVYKKLLSYNIFHKNTPLPYPGKINKENKRNDNIQRFEKANVIIIQVESLDSKAIDFRINRKLVMPFLNRLKNYSVYFKNFFAQHSGGASTDADLGMLTSLLPSPHHVGLYTADHNRIQSLVEVLEERDYTSMVMSSVTLMFHDKMSSYPKIGFDHFYDSNFYSGHAAGWYSKDLHFFDQSVPIIKSPPKPFFAYFIAHQSHGPFRNYSHSTKEEFNFDNTDFTQLEIDYLMSMHEVDRALEHFFNELLKLGILNDTILIIYGDHVGQALTDPGCLAECIPLFMYHKNLPSKVEIKAGSHIDLAPTITDLLDISEPEGWLGTSLFYNGNKTVLFNDLTVIEEKSGVLKRYVNINYQPYLEYSNSIVE